MCGTFWKISHQTSMTQILEVSGIIRTLAVVVCVMCLLLEDRLRQRFCKIRYSRFGIVGLRLFNMLPKELRNITNCDLNVFKRKLDEFLKTVPDEPLVSGLYLVPESRPKQPHSYGLVCKCPASQVEHSSEYVSGRRRPTLATVELSSENHQQVSTSINQHWFKKWLGTDLAPYHFLEQ